MTKEAEEALQARLDARLAPLIKREKEMHADAKLMRAIKKADGMSLIIGKGNILAWYKGEKYLSWEDLEKALVG